jgi:transcriptional regulator with PAS, ATPase and Fis domain
MLQCIGRGSIVTEKKKTIKIMQLQSIKNRFEIVGNSPALNHALETAIKVAPTDMSVLILGESGVGKESFSKIIHAQSARKHANFIAVNCGAIPEGTIYSELFGHEKGAYTGASTTDARKGYFESADSGTIFLDEVGEMPLDTQAMLLRVLESGDFIRMGSSKPLKTDVRVIAATNVNLEQAIEKGKFREDLYYRLNTVPIYVPALRERGNDIDLLFRKFSMDFAEKYNVPYITLSNEAKEVLLSYRFSGNVRQLKNIAEQVSLLEENRIISGEKMREYLPQKNQTNALTLSSNKNYEQGQNNYTDREILFKIMFDLRNDVTELKKLVFQIIQNSNAINAESLNLYQEMLDKFENTEKSYDLDNLEKYPVKNNDIIFNKNDLQEKKGNIIEIEEDNYTNKKNTEDIAHEEAEDILSIEQKEKELIIKALQKNKNRRKNAAKDLGISERTLYRKLKQYDLES